MTNPVTQALVEIPPDIMSLMASDPARAMEWRASSRAGLEKAMETGYRLDGVRLAAGRVHYVLTKPKKRK
jgi:predicted GNAT superfamily acetyltransferase